MPEAHDPYTDPDSGVLKNKLGLRDAQALQRAENELSTARAAEPIPAGDFDLAHMCAIHRQLFGDVYPWAGEVRTVNIAKEGTPFARPEFIEAAAKEITTDLARRDHLQHLPRDRFAEELGEVYADLNMLHPFREGNGRATRRFAEALAENAGYELDWSRVDRAQWIEASKASARGNNELLQDVFKAVTREPAHDLSLSVEPAGLPLPLQELSNRELLSGRTQCLAADYGAGQAPSVPASVAEADAEFARRGYPMPARAAEPSAGAARAWLALAAKAARAGDDSFAEALESQAVMEAQGLAQEGSRANPFSDEREPMLYRQWEKSAAERHQSQAADKAAAYRDLPREQAQARYPDLAHAYRMEAAARSMAKAQYGAKTAEAVAQKTRERIAAHIERGGEVRELAEKQREAPARDRGGLER